MGWLLRSGWAVAAQIELDPAVVRELQRMDARTHDSCPRKLWIEGPVMTGRREQASAGGRCPDARYRGAYRLAFTEDGFTGVFGCRDEEPGFQGRRRK